ncbi:MAG: hypothetical protein J0L60_06990 [Ignavibacteria bacterium]|nr:hypothetical protein [Ignavibacteria bacterium]
MTTAEMITRVRSLLDEREAGFWSDAEVMDALNDGQDEVVNYCLFVFAEGGVEGELPLLLTPLETEQTIEPVTAADVVLPSDFMYLLSVKCAPTTGASLKPCMIRSTSMARYSREHNRFLKPDGANLYAFLRGGKLVFEVPPVNGSVVINYIRKGSRISEEQNCELPDNASGAIISYAAALLLEKDKQSEEAGRFFGMFTNKIELLSQL